MENSANLIFIHGLMGTSQGEKAILLRQIFPGILTPDFVGSLSERMERLEIILAGESHWKIIGSSYGGLMGAIFTCRHPERVEKLVLLAPALTLPEFAESLPAPVPTPVILYHGSRDEIIPPEPTRLITERIFPNLVFNLVDDGHGLYETVHRLDWRTLLDFEER